MEYYKKLDFSIFHDGTTLPQRYVDAFVCRRPLQPGTSRKVTLSWSGKGEFEVLLSLINRKSRAPVYQLRWHSNSELVRELRKEFIQSYIAIMSKKYDAGGKKRHTNLLGGNQEVLIFRPINSRLIELETFVRVPTPYDNILKRLVEENVFGWLSKTNRDRLITKSTKWFDKSELKNHLDACFVIYYLLDTKKKQIYIGSAQRLGTRVKEGRHEIPGWSKFKYEIVHPDYHHLLKRIEFHSIDAFASFFHSNGSIASFPVSEFRLVNKSWPKLR